MFRSVSNYSHRTILLWRIIISTGDNAEIPAWCVLPQNGLSGTQPIRISHTETKTSLFLILLLYKDRKNGTERVHWSAALQRNDMEIIGMQGKISSRLDRAEAFIETGSGNIQRPRRMKNNVCRNLVLWSASPESKFEFSQQST